MVIQSRFERNIAKGMARENIESFFAACSAISLFILESVMGGIPRSLTGASSQDEEIEARDYVADSEDVAVKVGANGMESAMKKDEVSLT